MTEGQQFFLILCLLCLSECVLWVKPQAWVFLSGWWGRWKVSRPGRHGTKGRFVLCQPLPPLGWGFVCGEGSVAASSASVAFVHSRMAAFDAATKPLRTLAAWVVMPVFFILVPLTYWRWGAVPAFWIVLALAWVAMGVSSIVFFRIHRRLYPEKPQERWQHAILAAVIPQHSVRVTQVLARHWLADSAPLAVAAAVLSRSAFLDIAGREYRRLVFPLPRDADRAGGCGSGIAPSETVERATLESIVREAGLDPPAMLAPPDRQGEAQAFCPRCHGQFADRLSGCADCNGMPLTPFP